MRTKFLCEHRIIWVRIRPQTVQICQYKPCKIHPRFFRQVHYSQVPKPYQPIIAASYIDPYKTQPLGSNYIVSIGLRTPFPPLRGGLFVFRALGVPCAHLLLITYFICSKLTPGMAEQPPPRARPPPQPVPKNLSTPPATGAFSLPNALIPKPYATIQATRPPAKAGAQAAPAGRKPKTAQRRTS